MKNETDAFERFKVYTWAPEPEADEIVSSRWLLKQREPSTVKARIVAQQLNTGTPMDTFAATPTTTAQRLVMLIVFSRRLGLKLGDVGTAFLHAPLTAGVNIFVRPPVNLRRHGQVWRLHKALYGLRQSPRLFQEFLAEALAASGWKRCVVEPQLYFHGRTGAWMTAHADDLMMAAPMSELKTVMGDLESRMRIKWGECREPQKNGEVTD